MPVNYRAIVRAYVRSAAYKPKSHAEYTWARACARKVWFRTEEQANKAAARRGFTAYKCRFCEWWHLAGRKGK